MLCLLALKGILLPPLPPVVSAGSEEREGATQVPAVLPQPSGTHRLQSPHRGAR